MFESLTSCFAFRCSAPLNMTVSTVLCIKECDGEFCVSTKLTYERASLWMQSRCDRGG